MFEGLFGKKPAKPAGRPTSGAAKPASGNARPAAAGRPAGNRPPAPAANKNAQARPLQRRDAGREVNREADDIDAAPMAPAFATGSTRPTQPARPVSRGLAPTVKGREPTDDELREIKEFTGEVVTKPDGTVRVTETQQQYIAALGDGTVLVASSAANGSEVQSVRLFLQKASFRVERVFLVDLSVIREVYAADQRRNGSRDARPNSAQMQKAVIDLIAAAAEMGCSDIHITVERDEALIRVRSDGVMVKLRDLRAATAKDLCQAAFNMADVGDGQYTDLSYQAARLSSVTLELPPGVQSVRMQFNPLGDGGRYLVMRLLYDQKSSKNKDVDQLGYSPVQIHQLNRMRARPVGLIVISGPTGSGKSTTLQTALQATAEQKRYEETIITIEDPPEYIIRGAAQLPITNVKTEDDRQEAFRKAIVSALRSDPNIIMIGEIRDGASAKLAFQASMTGHKVYASLHANDSIAILDRLRDMGVENYKLSDSSLLAGLIGQRLVRRLCPDCSVPFTQAVKRGIVDHETIDTITRLVPTADLDMVHVSNPDGCPTCRGRGNLGRTVVAETILPDLEFMEMIARGDKRDAREHWLTKLGGMTMLEHAACKMMAGEIDPREINNNVDLLDDLDPERLSLVLERESKHLKDMQRKAALPKEQVLAEVIDVVIEPAEAPEPQEAPRGEV